LLLKRELLALDPIGFQVEKYLKINQSKRYVLSIK